MQPLVSVIIPMYNAEKTIIDCLNSVKNQEYEGSFEIIIVNDGSTDKSVERVQEFISKNTDLTILLFHQKNKGVSVARNFAIKKAKGEYIALLDSDDEWLPEKTKIQMDVLNKHTEIDFLATRGQNKKILPPYYFNEDKLAEITFRKLLFRNEILVPSVLFYKKVTIKAGFFDNNQRYAEDVNYWLKISKQNKMYILDNPLVVCGKGKKTFGVSGLSANLKEMHHGFLSNLKLCLHKKWINPLEYVIYYMFYKIKYLVLWIRS